MPDKRAGLPGYGRWEGGDGQHDSCRCTSRCLLLRPWLLLLLIKLMLLMLLLHWKVADLQCKRHRALCSKPKLPYIRTFVCTNARTHIHSCILDNSLTQANSRVRSCVRQSVVIVQMLLSFCWYSISLCAIALAATLVFVYFLLLFLLLFIRNGCNTCLTSYRCQWHPMPT